MLPPTVWKYVRGGMLFGVSASDPLTVTLTALLLGAVAFAAAFTPAQQPPPANRTRSLPGLWHGDASGHHALVRETGSGQNAWVSFGKQGWVNSRERRSPVPEVFLRLPPRRPRHCGLSQGLGLGLQTSRRTRTAVSRPPPVRDSEHAISRHPGERRHGDLRTPQPIGVRPLFNRGRTGHPRCSRKNGGTA